MLARTEDEIQDEISNADESLDGGSRWPGMTFEEGVSAALRWAIGETDEKPLED